MGKKKLQKPVIDLKPESTESTEPTTSDETAVPPTPFPDVKYLDAALLAELIHLWAILSILPSVAVVIGTAFENFLENGTISPKLSAILSRILKIPLFVPPQGHRKEIPPALIFQKIGEFEKRVTDQLFDGTMK